MRIEKKIYKAISLKQPWANLVASGKKIIETRDWLLEEHKNYYANVIANVGLYEVNKSVKKIEEAKNLEDLKNIWLGLSEDERRDGEIIKVKEKLKKLYEKN